MAQDWGQDSRTCRALPARCRQGVGIEWNLDLEKGTVVNLLDYRMSVDSHAKRAIADITIAELGALVVAASSHRRLDEAIDRARAHPGS